jgi:antitoxin ParD1/3/4
MNISLPPQMQRFLETEVRAGRYATTSEAVRDGIRLLQERKAERAARLVELRKAVAVGIAQADRGETAPLNLEDVLAKVRAKRRGGR